MKRSIVIPCCNEQKTIRALVDAVRAAPRVDQVGISYSGRTDAEGGRDGFRAPSAIVKDNLFP